MKNSKTKRIAVVGAGIFGSTIAIRLAKNGASVDLYERRSEIMKSASGINQFRLHRGYHYPRSIETAVSSRDAELSFMEEYGDAVLSNNDHFYCIARDKSKVSTTQFIDFCDQCNLVYERVDLDLVDKSTIESSFKVQESLINPVKLSEIVKILLNKYKVNLHLSTEIFEKDLDAYDCVINCTYANLNFLAGRNSSNYKENKYQFELCEKPLLRLPIKFKNKSIVVLDGPFMCIDPYADTDLHLMGNVVHAIHYSNVGFSPEIPDKFRPLLDSGVIKNPPISNIRKFIDSASAYISGIKDAEHVGSMFTVRTVLANVDHTDERPTIVSEHGKIINVFSGKLGNCVEAAKAVQEIVFRG